MNGGITLLNSNLNTLSLHFRSFFKMPRNVIDEIFSLQRKVLWRNNRENKGLLGHCIPLHTKYGKLGGNNLEAFNVALLHKSALAVFWLKTNLCETSY